MNGQFRPSDVDSVRPRRSYGGEGVVAGHRTWMFLGNYHNLSAYEALRNSRHMHSYHEVCLSLAGKGWFDHGENRHEIRPGDLFLAHPGVVHEIISAKRPILEICFISFAFHERVTDDSSADADLIARFERDRKVIVPDCFSMLRHFQALAQVPAEDETNWRIVSTAIASALVLEIVARASAPAPMLPSAPNVSLAARDPRLEMAFRFMDDNLERPLPVVELARQAMTSERTLRRLVREATGRSVVAEFARRRVHTAARRLIASPASSVAEIGYGMGFTDPSQFTREFRKIVGISPGAFRKRGGTVFEGSPTGERMPVNG